MAWVVRHRARYFYRSTRVGGRVVCRYLGRGPEAERAAAEIERRRAERAAARERRERERRRFDEALGPLGQLCELTDLVLGLSLVAAGFRKHARGTWRLRHA